MINFETFKCLYNEALEYDNFEFYIAERGWQEWMNPFDADDVSVILEAVYRIAREPLKATRERLGYSRAAFSRTYEIPIRTVEDWDSKGNIAKYTETLIKYTLFIKEMSDDEIAEE